MFTKPRPALAENIWFNAVGFQIIWWLSILYGEQYSLLVIVILATHVALNKTPLTELKFITLVGVFGFSLDTILTFVGIFDFSLTHSYPPYWLLLLWIGFAATIRHSLAFLPNHIAVLAITGAIGGTMSYLAAYKLGAFEFGVDIAIGCFLLASLWSFLMPIFFCFKNYFETIEV